MKWGLKVLPKKEVLDGPGRTLTRMINLQGIELQNIRYGKYLILEFDSEDSAWDRTQLIELVESQLVNTLIEEYELEEICE